MDSRYGTHVDYKSEEKFSYELMAVEWRRNDLRSSLVREGRLSFSPPPTSNSKTLQHNLHSYLDMVSLARTTTLSSLYRS